MSLTSIPEAINRFANGEMVVVVDDEERENEGDLILAAEKANPENIAFMIRHTSGIICAPAEAARLEALQLPAMVENNSDPLRTAFTISTDYVCGMTTGVSAEERARTLNALADDGSRPDEFIRPGHVFPLRYRNGGVLARSGHTEAAVDLCRLAELTPVGALAEINNDDGTMMRLPQLVRFARQHELAIISIEDLIRYRAEHEELVTEVSHQTLAVEGRLFRAHVFESTIDGKLVTALVRGNITPNHPTLVRVVKGVTGRDFLASALVGGNVISESLKLIGEATQGVFIYLPAEDEVPDDEQNGSVWREIGVGSHILASLGVSRIHLLASRDFSYPGIASFGLSIESIIKEDLG